MSLLIAHDGNGEFLESPIVEAADDHAQNLGARLQAALCNGFHVERELAGGGMSRVFIAEETRLGRRVVVKVFPPALRAVMSAERFHRETRLAAALATRTSSRPCHSCAWTLCGIRCAATRAFNNRLPWPASHLGRR